ncbi:MAG: class I tRNA ligase family protein, partial [Caulobacteraceae bacterium]
FSTLGWPQDTPDLERFYPTDTLVTGFDIIFFWVARMMMMGLKFKDQVPFKRVVINGLVRDERGQKMSKSKGNVIDPLDVIDELGCDALRFTMAILSGTRDIKLSKTRIEGYRNFGTKLWNAARFCQMNECVSQANFDPSAVRETVNRWIRGEVVKTTQAVTEAFEAARFDDAANALYRFVWNVFCDWYLELAKPILNGGNEAAKAETRCMAAWTLDQALALLHPISPFITEELWEQTAEFGPKRKTLLIESAWPTPSADWIDAEAEAETDWLINLVTEVRSIRSEMSVPPGAKAPLTLVGVDAMTRARITRNKDRLCTLARLSHVHVADAVPAGTVQFVVGEATGALSIAEFIDLRAEKARLDKALATLAKDVDRIRNKLDNADFIARAPEAVVVEQREKMADAQAAIIKMQSALARLANLE